MSKFIFITKHRYLKDINVSLYNLYTPVIFDMKSEYYFQSMRINYKSIWDYIDVNMFNNFENKIIKLSKEFFINIKKELKYKSIDIYENTKYTFIHFIELYLLSKIFLNNFFSKEKLIKEIIIDTNLKKTINNYNENDILEAICIKDFSKKNIKIISLKTKNQKKSKKITKTFISNDNIDSKENNIIYYSSKTDFKNSRYFLKNIKNTKVNVLNLNGNDSKNFKFINLNNIKIKDFEFKSVLKDFNKLLNKFYNINHKNKNIKDIVNNQFLKFYIKYIFLDVFITVYMTGKKIKKIVDKSKNNLIITGLSYHYIPRTIVNEGKKLNIPTFQISHGLIQNTIQYNSNSDYFEVWGHEMAKQIKTVNKNIKTYIIGSRYHEKETNKNSRTENKLNKILFLDSSVDHTNMIYKINFSKHLKSILEIVNYFNKDSKYTLNVKSHPNMNYKNIIKDLNLSKRIKVYRSNKKLKNALVENDIVLCLNRVSTAIIDAMIQNKPVILYKIKENTLKPSYNTFNSIIEVNTLSELKKYFIKLETDTNFKNNYILNQKTFKKNYINNDGKSNERIINVINKILCRKIINEK